MKVLLIIPPVDTCRERLLNIGLMNLYLVGKNLGCEIELLDLTGLSYNTGLQRILSSRYDIIGISCNFTNAAYYCMQYARDIKYMHPDTIIISGGNHATMAPRDLLCNKYDYIVYGEGEITFEEFLKRFLEGKEVEDLKGLCYLKDGEIVKNQPREPIEDLDALPLNDYSEFNIRVYSQNSGLRYVSLETSRGCIYNCSFCSTVKMWGNRYRRKSPQRIVREFKIAAGLKVDFVFIEDDDIAIDEYHLRAFCRALIDEEIYVPWSATFGSGSIRDVSTFDLMVRSGCVKANICIESANPRILKAYRKPYTVEDNKRICLNLRKNKILVHNHGMIGFSDETIRESLNTYFYLMKTSPMWHVSILEPRPGSDYWEDWVVCGNLSQYKLFGKANVMLARRKVSMYLIYRIFALFYFLNPNRICKALCAKNKGVKYNYRMQYSLAYGTLRLNILYLLRHFPVFYKYTMTKTIIPSSDTL